MFRSNKITFRLGKVDVAYLVYPGIRFKSETYNKFLLISLATAVLFRSCWSLILVLQRTLVRTLLLTVLFLFTFKYDKLVNTIY